MKKDVDFKKVFTQFTLQSLISSIVIKIIYFLFAYIVAASTNKLSIQLNWQDFLSVFNRNDSSWYQQEVLNGWPKITDPLDLGYSNGKDYKQSVWAHFPLYPLCVRYVGQLFQLNFNVSAFIISTIFSFLSFAGFYILGIKLFNKSLQDSLKFTFLFIVFPFHYFYSMFYTEAIFFSCLAFSFISINKKKLGLTSLILIPFTLVRPNGITCLLPLFIYYIETQGGFKEYWLFWKNKNWKKITELAYFSTAPLTLLSYCIYQKYMTGFYFAFIKAQAGWYKEFMFPLLALFRRSDFATQFNSIYTILIMVICVLLIKKFPLSLNVLIWINILLPMASGSVASMPRYISVIFPLSIYFATYLLNNKWCNYILVFLFCLQLLTFYPWLFSHQFSY